MRNIFDYFVMKLEHRYSVDAVLKAIDRYTDTKNDIPTPADIINTIDPPITYAQYKAAETAQEKNGYPRFSYEATVIQKYHAQQSQQTDESGKLLPSAEKSMIEDKRESKDDQYTPEKMQRVGNYVQQALDAIAENERLAMARKSASE